MNSRIEVCYKIPDARSRVRKNDFFSNGFNKKIKEVFIVDVYTINKDLTKTQLVQISSMLSNPVFQDVSLTNPFSQKKFNYAIEIGFLPGVTDNVGNTAKEAIEDLLKIKFKDQEGVFTSQITFIDGVITENEAHQIGLNMGNPLIQRIHIKNFKDFIKEKGMDIIVPKVNLQNKTQVTQVNLNVPDEELKIIGRQGIKNNDGTRRGPLALDLTYMKTIQNYFKKLKRNPTDIELESIAQTWSEHCKHTIFADPIDDIKDGLYETYIKKATDEIRKKKSAKGRSSSGRDFCVSVFLDNSGAIEFDQKYLITHKAETHNSPSALDPYGGAITGIVGVNRDAIGFGLGAKPIINIYGYCFGDIKINYPLYKDPHLKQKMLPPERIMKGVIDGVNSGGNCSGIPTPQGFVFFEKRYQGKPLVFVGTVGLIPKKIGKKLAYKKQAKSGDYIVVVGGRVGQDGIHGATFSSEALSTGSPATAVQIGDPITQKKLSDALVKEARDLNLYNSITDNGAGGLSCSVAEMAKESGGFEVELEKIPLKYPGLEPWQIWISESQERMTLAVPKNKWLKFKKLMEKRGVEATVIGEFTKSKKCLVTYKGKKIMNMEMDFLHDGLPKRPMKTSFTPPFHEEPHLKKNLNFNQITLDLIKKLNIASFEFISSQYDHEVQGGSVLKPLQGKGKINGEASVTKPLLNSKKAVALSQGIYPTYSDIDTYHMAACSIDTAIRNLIAVGVDPQKIALLDNFCWCSPDDPQKLGELKRAVAACYDYATSYGTPFISGKDSMFNDFKGYDEKGNAIKISIPPTLLVSSIGIMDDAEKTVSIDLKNPGDLIYLLGETYDETGGSEFFNLFGAVGNKVPKVDAKKNLKLYKALYRSISFGLITSSISVTRGGLAVALAKMAMAGMLGIKIKFNKPIHLFSESQGRIVVTINKKNKEKFEKMMKGNPITLLGKVTEEKKIIINNKDKKIINLDLSSVLKNYQSTFKNY
ncbi:MAG: phosphoribosylformylglycinamidine synthase [Candidatus Roizmanbacteria bacterium]|nr:MAG: phosphoribosylformylglycinamidine synthase [Candidatus Roizmanbacteria bacterium]